VQPTISTVNPATVAPGQVPGAAACPLCHTEADGGRAQFGWQCRTCGQRWTALRLATVEAYATWAKAREL
jgi:ribosomal protein L37AE/L43A